MPKFGARVVWLRSRPSRWSTRMTAAFDAAERVSGGPASSTLPNPSTWKLKRSLRSSTAAATWLLKSARTRDAVTEPITTAKPVRMTNVSAAETMASRHRIGIDSSTEHVPRPADRVQQPRVATGLQLAAQVRDEHLDGVRRREGVVAPDLLEEALARDDDALVAHEVLEQLELALGQLDRALAAPDLVRVGVQRQVGDDERRAAPRRPPAQQRPQSGEQLLALERLDEVVVGARVEPFDARLDRVARGEHQDRHVVGRAQPPRDLDAVELGQSEVEDDEVGVVGRRLVERRLAVAGDAHVVAVQAQGALEDLGDLVVVLDDEHPRIATDTGHRTAKGRARDERQISIRSTGGQPVARGEDRRIGAHGLRVLDAGAGVEQDDLVVGLEPAVGAQPADRRDTGGALRADERALEAGGLAHRCEQLVVGHRDRAPAGLGDRVEDPRRPQRGRDGG